MSLLVKKVDGQQESYIHTRVMAAIAAATCDTDCYDEQTVHALADAVRMHIEDCKNDNNQSTIIPTDEIYSMILAALEETGLVKAAQALKRHRVNRQINRSRQMVLHCLKHHLPKEEQEQMDNDCCVSRKEYYICNEQDCPCLTMEPWNKSRLASSLISSYKMNKAAARALSGNIEEKVFNLKVSVVRTELIRQLIFNEFHFIRKHEVFFDVSTKNEKHNFIPTEIQEIPAKPEITPKITVE